MSYFKVLNNRLNTYFFVPKGLNINNPVRSAGEKTDHNSSPEGVECDQIEIQPLRGYDRAYHLPCVSHTVIQI